jgi:cobalt-zinc-cadmium efflux system protein
MGGRHSHSHSHGAHGGHGHDPTHGADHGHGSDAGHVHRHAPPSSGRQLFWALLLTGGCMIIEAVGGWLAGSLALLADSAHMLTDCASLAMSYAAVLAAARPATKAMSYGHHRWQVLAAFVNGLALVVLAVWIVVEAVMRLRGGASVAGATVAVVAALGLAVNIAAFAVLARGERSLNVRGALAHVTGDILGSLAALVAGAVIVLTGWMPIDALLSSIVALLMIVSGWRICRESAHILLEGAPVDCDAAQVERELRAHVSELTGVHHLHVWSLTDDRPVMTLHAVLREGADREQVLIAIQSVLRQRFGVEHATVQIEREDCVSAGCG